MTREPINEIDSNELLQLYSGVNNLAQMNQMRDSKEKYECMFVLCGLIQDSLDRVKDNIQYWIERYEKRNSLIKKD